MIIGIDAKRAYLNKSGLGNYSRDVISSLLNFDKINIQLFTTDLNNEIFNVPRNIKVHTPKIKLLKNYWRTFGLKKIINKEKIDIFHGLSNEIPVGINKNVKCIVTIHDVIYKKHPTFYNKLDKFIYSNKTKYACKKAKKIISVSNQTKKDLINYFNIEPTKIEVIYQSCHKAFKSELKDKNILKKYQLPDNYILYVGTIERRKNLKFLLKSIKENPNFNLVCIGKKKSYYKEVLNFISVNKIKNNITFLEINSVNDLSDIYKKAKCLVYPSIYEGFGIPIIEGLYSQIPVITIDKPIFREAGGDHCFYVNNYEELTKILIKIYNEKHERNPAAKKWAEKFNNIKQANQIVNIYQELLK